jgi:hypothetical protein
VAGLGHYSPVKAQLMSVPPFAVAFVREHSFFSFPSLIQYHTFFLVSIITAFLSDKYRARGLTMIFFSIICIIGFAMFLGMFLHLFSSNQQCYILPSGTNSKHVKYGSLFLSLPGTYCIAPTLSTWNANNTAPHVRRATAIAISFIGTNSGGILATWLLGSLSPPPKYTKAAITFVILSVITLLCVIANMYYLSSQNRRKAEVRSESEQKDEPKGLGDQSAWFVYNM